MERPRQAPPATAGHQTALEAHYAARRDAALESAARLRDWASSAGRRDEPGQAERLEHAADLQAELADLMETRRRQAADWRWARLGSAAPQPVQERHRVA